MRTFIAIPLPPECRAALEAAQSGLRSIGADVRWTAVGSIHLTLKFLGEIDPAVLADLARALAGAAAVEPFALKIQGLGAFPDLRGPRVVWCGLAGDTDALVRLQSAVETACVSLGFTPEQRPFHPHLTLGRVQGTRNLRQLAEYIRIAKAPDQEFGADRLEIYKSVLMPKGPVYTLLGRLPLGAEARRTQRAQGRRIRTALRPWRSLRLCGDLHLVCCGSSAPGSRP